MNKDTLFVMSIVFLSVILAGCSLTRHDLLKADTVEIEATPVANATYLYTSVYQDGEKLYISGRVALESSKVSREKRGHIDITARGSDGEMLMISHSPYIQHQHTGKRNQVAFYTAARLLIPEGSVVKFEHHWEKLGVHDPDSHTSSD